MDVDLRSFLSELKNRGELLEVGEEVDTRFEITAVLKEVLGEQGGPAVHFRNVRGYPGRSLAGNILASRRKMALALGCEVEGLRDTYIKKRFDSQAPVVWDGSAPAQKNVVDKDVDLLSLLPAPLFHQGDAGHYLTAGVLMARDPLTNELTMSIHRMQLKGKNLLGINLAHPPMADYLKRAEHEGEPMQVAVALGLHPAELLAAAVSLKAGMKSKVHLAGGLAGRPVALVKAKVIDLMVPALAETILEGQLLSGIREAEGPFGESSGYYFKTESPVMEVQAVTSRKEPILSIIPPWGIEIDIMLSLFGGGELWQELHRVIPGVLDVAFLPGSLTFQGVIKVSKSLSKSDVRRLIHLALNLDRRLKHVIVVDEDVDIHNTRDVLWALGTRFHGSYDLVCLQELEGYVIDPSTEDGKTTKIGFDATARPDGPDSSRYQRITLPQKSVLRAREILGKWPAE